MKEKNYELLRAISCIAIVFLHVSAWQYGDYHFGEQIDKNFYGASFYNTITRFAVPCFIMLTGAFTLPKKKNCAVRYYYRKSFYAIVVPTLIFSCIYTIYNILIEVLKGIDAVSAIKKQLSLWILYGDPYGHMWYMYMLIGFIIAAPFLCRLYQRLNTSCQWLVVVLSFVISCIYSQNNEAIWLLKFLQYLGYFFIGALIYEEYSKNKSHWACLVSAVVVIASTVATITISYFNNELSEKGLQAILFLSRSERLSPLVILNSIAVFICFASMNISINPLSIISESSFYIYLIHGGVISVLSNARDILLGEDLPSPWWYVPVFSIVVLLISFLAAKMCAHFLKKSEVIKR